MSEGLRDLPEGMMRPADVADGGDGKGRRLRAQVVVIGLGAGGAMVVHDLARAGVDVLGVEMGGYFRADDMTLREEQMLPRLFCEAGARRTADMAIGVMQGKGVGGSTLHNTNLCKRLPEPILEQWRKLGIEGLGDELQRDFEAVEKLLNVHPVPRERRNDNNQIMARGIRALGYAGGGLSYNRRLCRQAGFCELGCPNDGKENAERALIRPALKEGARVLIHTRVERVCYGNGQVTGLVGRAVDADKSEPSTINIDADHIVLAASATGSAALAQKSELPDPHGLVGSRLHMHPGAFVMGVFDEPVQGWQGVPQSVECTEFLDHGPQSDRRVWLVSGFAHPGAAAGLMPGFGPAHGALMKRYPNVAAIICMVHDRASGHVRPGDGERLHIHYRLDGDEYAQVALGMREAARILFAGGAQKVLLPTASPRLVSTMEEAAKLSAGDLGPLSPAMIAVHPMSTMWMGADPARSVVDSYGAYHHLKGLWVADGSLFPSSIGGPPQIPIYTMGRRVARRLLATIDALPSTASR